MGKKKKDVVINIEPFHAEVKTYRDGRFELWFYSRVRNDHTRKKIVKIKFKGWWLNFVASMLWKVQKKSQEVADEQAKALRNT